MSAAKRSFAATGAEQTTTEQKRLLDQIVAQGRFNRDAATLGARPRHGEGVREPGARRADDA